MFFWRLLVDVGWIFEDVGLILVHFGEFEVDVSGFWRMLVDSCGFGVDFEWCCVDLGQILADVGGFW